mgnify:CR=1 FL=1
MEARQVDKAKEGRRSGHREENKRRKGRERFLRERERESERERRRRMAMVIVMAMAMGVL